MKENIDVFNKIYEESYWGYKSGPGSSVENAKDWIESVNYFLSKDDINTVVDLGCGDWRLGKEYVLLDKEYLGIDVSSLIVDEIMINSTDNIKFIQGDVSKMSLPSADLILIKDVLQHLPNESVIDILNQIIEKSNYALICEDFSELKNINIKSGEWRALNLNDYPFFYNFTIIKSWNVKEFNKVIYLYKRKNYNQIVDK